MKKLIFLLLLNLILLNCTGVEKKNISRRKENFGLFSLTTTSSKNPLEDYPNICAYVLDNLERGYKEKFGIKRVAHIRMTDVYVLYCYPLNDPDFVFQAKTGGKYGYGVYDRYGKERLDDLVENYYNPIIDRLFPYKKITNPNFNTYTKWGRIPSAKELIEEDSKNTKIYINIHIFENVIETDKENFVNSIMKLATILKEQNLKGSQLHIYIYQEEYFTRIDPTWLMKSSDWFSHSTSLIREGVAVNNRRYREFRTEVIVRRRLNEMSLEELRFTLKEELGE